MVIDGHSAKAKRTAYDRWYYHAVRKPKGYKQSLSAAQKAKRNARQRQRYIDNPDHMRALARANYWRHREKYKEANRLREAAKRAARRK